MDEDQPSSDYQQDESNERERNILESLPSRQISAWRRKTYQRKNNSLAREKSINGKMYMSVDRDDVDNTDTILDLDESGKFMEHRPLNERLEERRRLRSTSTSDHHSLSFIKGIRFRIEMRFKLALEKLKDWLQMLSLWRGHFKEIEGSFGNGILSFFTFLRWLFLVNLLVFIIALSFLVIPQAVSTKEVPAVVIRRGNSSSNSTSLQNVSSDSTVDYIIKSHAGFFGANTTAEALKRGCSPVKLNTTSHLPKGAGEILSDFMQGMGWINTTVMFYGSYSSQILIMPTGSFYNMPIAYFTVSTVSFVIVLLLTLWSASSIIEESYIKDGVKHYNSYANKIFAGWDMCITDENAAKLKVKSLVREIEGDLAEDLRLANLSARTQKQRCQIYCIRLSINLIVMSLSVGAGWAIYEAAQLSFKTAQTNSKVQSSQNWFVELCFSYASSITITVLNSVLPALFYFLSQLEDWNPRVQVNIDLARTVLLKLASVAVLVISLFLKIDKDDCILCWENAIATEMYKLIWMDFLVVTAVVVAYHTPRRYIADYADFGFKLGKKIGRPVFLIPQNVLELVYAQCLIWIGMWYSPLLTLMGCVKFFVIFYVKKLTLKYNCRGEDKPYRAGKSNYFFMLLLLVTFFLCVAAVVYGVSQIRPSFLYGPFRGLDRMYSIVPFTIQTLPVGIQDMYNVVKNPVFVTAVVILICLGLYFFYASAKVYNRMIMELREELAMESRDKKFLLKKLGVT